MIRMYHSNLGMIHESKILKKLTCLSVSEFWFFPMEVLGVETAKSWAGPACSGRGDFLGFGEC